MKKTLLLCMLLAGLLLLAGCSQTPVPDAEAEQVEVDLEIREKMFLAQTNDVYLNADDYLGKTIRLEGIFFAEQYAEDIEPFCMVARYGPGCCGDDGFVGFEVALDTAALKMPETNEWVEAIGTLEQYEENGVNYLRLDLNRLTVLSERGMETVTQ